MKKNTKNVLIGVFIVIIAALLALFLMIFLRINKTRDYNEQLSLGDRYLQEMNYEDAAIAYQNAIHIDEKKETGHIRLSDVYIATEDYDQAADVLLTGYDATGESDLIRDKMISIYPQVSDDYKEKIEDKIGEVESETASGDENDAEPTAAPQEEPAENAFTGSVVGMDDRIFYWKYNAQSYEPTGALAYFGSGWLASNQLVCRDADGTEQVLLESTAMGDAYIYDCGTLGIGGGRLFFDMPDPSSTDAAHTNLFSYALDTGEITNYGAGHLKAVTGDGRAIGYIMNGDDTRTIFITSEDGGLTPLVTNASQYLDYHDGAIYFQPQESGALQATLSCVFVDTQQVQNLYTAVPDFPVDSYCTISQIAYQDDRIYFAFGSYGGSAVLYQGGKVACVNRDGSDGHIASGSEVFYEPCFRVAEDGTAVVDDPDSSYTTAGMQEYYSLEGNLYYYNRAAGGQAELLVSPEDYASFGSGLMGVMNSDSTIYLEDATLAGNIVYYRLDACIGDPSSSIGWRTGYSRQYSALFEKDLETGTVTEIYRY
ncbi:MAG: hypothetical protein ACOX8E_06945 [Ruminococcus sp.]